MFTGHFSAPVSVEVEHLVRSVLDTGLLNDMTFDL